MFSLSTLSAREVYSLNEEWRFFFSHENSGDSAREVVLPHTWNNDALSGIYPYMRTSANYTRQLYIPQAWSAKRIFVHFKGAETTLDLFVNGMHAGSHSGAGVAFTIEISDWVKFGSENELLAVVNNSPNSLTMPISSEQNIYGGITREVSLIVTDKVAISPLHYGSDGVIVRTTHIADNQAEGEALVYLSVPTPQAVEVTLKGYNTDGKELFVQKRALKSSYDFTKPITIPFIVENPKLWSVDNPNLYRFEATVKSSEMEDCVSVVSGLRTVLLTPKGLYINGERVRVNGVSLSYDHPADRGLYSQRAIDDDMALLLDLGATALRSPMAPHPQALYDRCDKEGILAWIDLPFVRTRYLSDVSYYATSDFEEGGVTLLKEIIWQNINHPSVVMWGLFSNLKAIDSRLCDYIRLLNQTAHKCDPTRPTVATSNSDGEINFITDAIVWHQNVGWGRGMVSDLGLWFEQLYNNWGHLKSAICYGAEGSIVQQPDSYRRPTPQTMELPERRQSRFHEDYSEYTEADSVVWGRWINSLCDYGSARHKMSANHSGLVDFDRKSIKDSYYLYRALWNKRDTTLHIADQRWRVRPTESQRFRVYVSEGLEPLLTINGDTVALTRKSACVWLSDEVAPLESMNLVVTAADHKAEAHIECGSALKAPLQQAPLQTIGLQLIN